MAGQVQTTMGRERDRPDPLKPIAFPPVMAVGKPILPAPGWLSFGVVSLTYSLGLRLAFERRQFRQKMVIVGKQLVRNVLAFWSAGRIPQGRFLANRLARQQGCCRLAAFD